MAKGTKRRPPSSTLRSALLRFFRSLVKEANSIKSVNTDVRGLLGFDSDDSGWQQLAPRINALPEVRRIGARLRPSDLKRASTIADIEALLNRRALINAELADRLKDDSDRFSSSGAYYSRSAHTFVPPTSAEYRVWYGTNRRPNDPADLAKGFSAQRDTRVHFGSCEVHIPKWHKIGSVGSAWWKRVVTWTDDRLKLTKINEMEDTTYWNAIASHLTLLDASERDAVIFIHGYNVNFESAALRAAQIGFDLGIKGAMAFFSWPSQGTLTGYPADEATIEASEEIISDFISSFATQTGAKAVHIIAHSMGNRGVLRAVNRIAGRAAQDAKVPFGQIILAAADVDADTFRNLCAAYGQVSSRTTLYVSARDLAVESSHWLHHFPRVGLIPPIFIIGGIDTINVTNVDLTTLGHGYVAAARDVLQDIHRLITHGAPPAQRFGLRMAMNEQGEAYWIIGE